MVPDNYNYTPTAIAAPLGRRYQILRRLGEGSFGQTFLAADLHLPGQPQCVVKQLQPTITTQQALQTARRLFETEANVLARLGEHEQIPRLLAHFEEKEEFYLVQALIEGQDLGTELSAEQRWTDKEVIAFLHDLLSTLTFVHKNQVIHRDIKPTNLIRRRSDQRIVLIDFGAVKQVGTQIIANPSDPAKSKPKTIAIGTEGYMPSEQLSGHPQFGSDIYATGMIAIQGLTGQSPSSLERDPSTGEIDWHPLCPQAHPGLKKLIDNMVRYDFRTRYDSAPTTLAALKALSASTTPIATASHVSEAPDATQSIGQRDIEGETSHAKTLLVSFGLGIAIAAMLGAGIVFGQKLPVWLGHLAEQDVVSPEELAAREAAEKEAAKREAIARIERLYGHISAKEWDQTTLFFSPELAERFRPDFFEKFEQVTVENLQVTYQTDEIIELIGQNTYIYPDGSFQLEERTYTMQLIDGEQTIVESELVKVLQPRQ